MENTEIMDYEDEVIDTVEIIDCEAQEPKIGTGAAIAIGVGLTLAVTAGVKLVKKMIKKHKAKKELRLVKEGEVVEVTDEEIMEVTQN